MFVYRGSFFLRVILPHVWVKCEDCRTARTCRKALRSPIESVVMHPPVNLKSPVVGVLINDIAKSQLTET